MPVGSELTVAKIQKSLESDSLFDEKLKIIAQKFVRRYFLRVFWSPKIPPIWRFKALKSYLYLKLL